MSQILKRNTNALAPNSRVRNTSASLPAVIPLSGTDILMLAFDRVFRSDQGRGNVCALALQFREQDGFRRAIAALQTSELLKAIVSLRLARPFWLPYWRQTREVSYSIEQRNIGSKEELERIVAALDLDPRSESPLRFIGYQLEGVGFGILMIWSHVLFDARGAEYFIARLLSPNPSNSDITLVKERTASPVDFSEIKKAQKWIFDVCREPVQTFDIPAARAREFRYRHIEFSDTETALLDNHCRDLGAEVFRSSVFLAAFARTLSRLRSESNRSAPFFLSVPHNLRRASSKYLLGNHVTFFFYRIPAEALATLREGVLHLIGETHALITTNLQQATVRLLQAARILPLALFSRLLLKPSRGTLSSFYFSDTGALFDQEDISELLSSVVHYPPYFTRPGLTAVFSRFRERLQVMLIAGEGNVSERELDAIEYGLRAELLGEQQVEYARQGM